MDDDPTVRASLTDALGGEGFDVASAENGARALAAVASAPPDIVLCDVRMPVMDGLTLLRELRARAPEIDVVVMSAYDQMDTVIAAMRDGAAEFLIKPVGFQQVAALTRRLVADRAISARAHREADVAPARFGEIIGHDPRMIAVYKMVGQASACRATVLVRGESGTGKELVARAIHAHSNAAGEPFVAVNCAALPANLLESELFGHVKGAFTGAHESRRGRFAVADRGTIFLDEIGDTSLEMQGKLLRVIQDREFQPVGSERTERTEARVIAATHRPLETMIADGRFREDLYYRLRVVEVVIPPLRERVGDIPVLARHMVRRAAAALSTNVPVLAEDALERLRTHRWPGNARELENCLLRAVVQSSGVIRAEHLSIASPGAEAPERLVSLDEVEREQILRVLAATGYHKGKAAEILKVSRPRLNRLLRKYGVD